MSDDDLTSVWKALSDPGRRKILDYLKERPRTTSELSDLFETSRFTVMKNLTVLERAGLVIVRRRGRERWNHLNLVPLQRIYERWLRPYEAQWASTLLHLKRTLEEEPGERTTPMSEQTAVTSPLGFLRIEQEITIEASPSRVFKALTNDVSAWWGAPYLISNEARSLVLEPKIGGRFYEDWGNGAGSLWGLVTSIKQDAWIEVRGSMAMSGIVSSVVRFELEAQGDATLVKLSHRAMGEVNEELQVGYDGGWHDLIALRLKALLEQGIRYGIGHEPPMDV
ncbi:MAG TPA: helix-turn-helix domain-containing protein [Ktedonobacteraceae bacterium]|nr:helix-turn-helix domain-containing protein [Ktedonobacteraceae bacterium]